MPHRLLILMAALSFSGCLCAGPPAGECTGTWGGVKFDRARIDPSSRVVIVNKTTCTGLDLKRYEISWAESKLQLNLSFTSSGPTVLTGEVTFPVPPVASTFLTFAVTPSVADATGELKLGRNGLEARTGRLSLSSGSESLICSFDVHTEPEGPKLKCSSGSSDFD